MSRAPEYAHPHTAFNQQIEVLGRPMVRKARQLGEYDSAGG
jgi:hypothetical protein